MYVATTPRTDGEPGGTTSLFKRAEAFYVQVPQQGQVSRGCDVFVVYRIKRAALGVSSIPPSRTIFGATPATWFDVSMFKVRGTDSIKLDEVPIPVKLTAKAPDSLRKDGRTFFLLHAHNREVTKAAEGKGDTLGWETDKFSTYLLAYKDAESSGSDKAGTKTDTNNKTTANTRPTSSSTTVASGGGSAGSSAQHTGTPHTSDVTNAALPFGLAVAAAALLAVSALRRRRDA